jgi:hypothetical protein
MHLNPSDTTELLDLYLDHSVPDNRTVDVLIGPSETRSRSTPKQVMCNKSFGLKIIRELDVLRQ